MHERPYTLKAILNIFLFTFYLIATASCQTPEDEIDEAKSGSYLIVYCNANTPGSHASYLQALISDMKSELQAVLTDLDRGTSSPAYRAFFKTNNNLDAVRQVFRDIINGSSFPSVGARNLTIVSPPLLVCADANQPFLHHFRDACEDSVMYVGFPAKVVAVCPYFWTVPRVARRSACPWVEDGRLMTEPWNLRTTQFAVLVHELVHIYNRFDGREEVYDMEDLVGLSAKRSLENAQNFATYAAGE